MVTKRKGRLKKLKGRMQSSLSGFFRACMVGALVLFQFAIIVATPFLFREFALQFYILIHRKAGIRHVMSYTKRNLDALSFLLTIFIFVIFSGQISFGVP